MAAGDFHSAYGSMSGTATIYARPASGVKWVVFAISASTGYNNYSSIIHPGGNSFIKNSFDSSVDNTSTTGNPSTVNDGWMNVHIPVDNTNYVGISHHSSNANQYFYSAIEWD